jgi:hypothetical protein
MFDFGAEETKTLSNRLSLMIAGPSGAGKSHLIGTYPGKVLYLTAGPEVHGVDAARKTGKNVTAIAIDRDKTGPLSADAALARFDAATDPESIRTNGFELIALDGLTELEKLVRASAKWKAICTTKGGGHDSFKEGPATIAMMDHCLTRLRNLQFDQGLDIAVTCILDVTETNKATGEIEAAKPRLQSYQVAESMIQQFGDIVIIGSMQEAGKSGRVIQMQTDLVRKSVDLDTKEVKKIFGITPRLQGVDVVPPYIRADLSAVLNLKGR